MNFLPYFGGAALLCMLGVTFLVAPTLRPRIAFGRTVAEDFLTSPDGRRILLRYRLVQCILLLLLLAGFLVWRFFMVRGIGPGWSMLALLVGYVAAASTTWIAAYRSTAPFAVRIPLVRTAPLVIDRRIEIVHLAALLPLATASLLLLLAWSRIPAVFPIHWSGLVPSGWAHRSIAAVYGPIALGVVLVVGFWLLLRYATPGTGRMRWILPAIAWYSAVFNSCVALLPLRANPAAYPIMRDYAAPAMLLLICGIVIVRHLRPQRATEGDGTPDNRWVAGIFYFNPQDPALFVEKRMGIGWTLNFAHPASWLLLACILMVPVVLVVKTFLGHG